MSTTTTKTASNAADRAATLRKIRATVRPCADRGKAGASLNGIYLVARFRTEDSARRLAALVESFDEGQAFVEKTHKAKYTGDLTWRVDFSVDLEGDYYIETGSAWPTY